MSDSHSVILRVIQTDPSCDLLEVETLVSVGAFSGVCRSYDGAAHVRDLTRQFETWTERPEGAFEFRIGDATSTGLAQLGFRVVGQARRIQCRITLRTDYAHWGKEHCDGSELAVTMPVELAGIDRFIRDLYALADGRATEAILPGRF